MCIVNHHHNFSARNTHKEPYLYARSCVDNVYAVAHKKHTIVVYQLFSPNIIECVCVPAEGRNRSGVGISVSLCVCVVCVVRFDGVIDMRNVSGSCEIPRTSRSRDILLHRA